MLIDEGSDDEEEWEIVGDFEEDADQEWQEVDEVEGPEFMTREATLPA